MIAIEYSYIDNDNKKLQSSINIEWIAKVSPVKYQIKFVDNFESIIDKKLLYIIVNTDKNKFKFENVEFLPKDNFIVGSDGIYDFIFSQIIKF